MYKWEIHCCNLDNDSSSPYMPQASHEVQLFVYGDTETEALDKAKKLVVRGAYQTIECVEELNPEAID